MPTCKKIVLTALLLTVWQHGFLVQQQLVQGLEVGDEVCVEGYIMDQFCINLGVLLDNPAVKTLENPGAHSIHCLLEVGVCSSSDYVVLLDPGSASSPVESPVGNLTPTTSPTATPTSNPPTIAPTKAPTIAPTKAPIASFAFLFAALRAKNTQQPINAPTASPTSNDDDFFSILYQPSKNVTESSKNVKELPAFNLETSSLYTVGYVLDDVGKALITQIGLSVGICSTCSSSGSISAGLRAEVRGIVTEVSTTLGPHKLAVSSVQLSNNLTSICQPPVVSSRLIGNGTIVSPSQSPSFLRSPDRNGLFSRVRNVFDSLFVWV